MNFREGIDKWSGDIGRIVRECFTYYFSSDDNSNLTWEVCEKIFMGKNIRCKNANLSGEGK